MFHVFVDTTVAEWITSPVINAQLTTKENTKTVSTASIKENDTAVESEHKIDMINKATHFKCDSCNR